MITIQNLHQYIFEIKKYLFLYAYNPEYFQKLDHILVYLEKLNLCFTDSILSNINALCQKERLPTSYKAYNEEKIKALQDSVIAHGNLALTVVTDDDKILFWRHLRQLLGRFLIENNTNNQKTTVFHEILTTNIFLSCVRKELLLISKIMGIDTENIFMLYVLEIDRLILELLPDTARKIISLSLEQSCNDTRKKLLEHCYHVSEIILNLHQLGLIPGTRANYILPGELAATTVHVLNIYDNIINLVPTIAPSSENQNDRTPKDYLRILRTRAARCENTITFYALINKFLETSHQIKNESNRIELEKLQTSLKQFFINAFSSVAVTTNSDCLTVSTAPAEESAELSCHDNRDDSSIPTTPASSTTPIAPAIGQHGVLAYNGAGAPKEKPCSPSAPSADGREHDPGKRVTTDPFLTSYFGQST